MEKKMDIAWDEEIVMDIFAQELIPQKELLSHICFMQLLESLEEEAQSNG